MWDEFPVCQLKKAHGLRWRAEDLNESLESCHIILELELSELTTCIHSIDEPHDIGVCLDVLEAAEVRAADATRSRTGHLYGNLNRSAWIGKRTLYKIAWISDMDMSTKM